MYYPTSALRDTNITDVFLELSLSNDKIIKLGIYDRKIGQKKKSKKGLIVVDTTEENKTSCC